MKLALIGMALASLCIGGAAGQSGTEGPGFEVASIKPSDVSTASMHVGVSPSGVFTAQGATLKALIQQAYELRDFQVSGGPAWIDKDRYDINAKSSNMNISDDEMRKMTAAQRDLLRQQFMSKLRVLLADRFQLKAHQEERELPVYALIVAKDKHRMQASTDSASSRPGVSTRRVASGIEITGKAATMPSLAKALSNQLDRLVLNHTGLEGEFDFKLTYSPDLAPQQPGGREGEESSRMDSGPSLFTAVQEQLGLKLESEHGPVPVLIIDDARKASEN